MVKLFSMLPCVRAVTQQHFFQSHKFISDGQNTPDHISFYLCQCVISHWICTIAVHVASLPRRIINASFLILPELWRVNQQRADWAGQGVMARNHLKTPSDFQQRSSVISLPRPGVNKFEVSQPTAHPKSGNREDSSESWLQLSVISTTCWTEQLVWIDGWESTQPARNQCSWCIFMSKAEYIFLMAEIRHIFTWACVRPVKTNWHLCCCYLATVFPCSYQMKPFLYTNEQHSFTTLHVTFEGSMNVSQQALCSSAATCFQECCPLKYMPMHSQMPFLDSIVLSVRGI